MSVRAPFDTQINPKTPKKTNPQPNTTMKTLTFYNRLNPIKWVTKFLLLAGLATVMGSTLYADYTWTGAGDSNFWNPANWSAGYGNSYGVSDIFAMDSINVTQPNGTIASGVEVDGTGSPANAPVLHIVGVGTNRGWVSIGATPSWASYGGNGVIFQTSGTVTNAYADAIGINVAAYTTGTAPMSTGTYNFGGTSAGTAPAFIPTTGQGQSNLGVTQIQVGGAGNGTMNLTGYGRIVCQNAHGLSVGVDQVWGSGHTGTSVLSITGGNLSITTNAFTLYGANSTLSETIDSTGISTINATTSAVFGTGCYFNLSLGTGFSGTMGQVFTLLSCSSGAIAGSFSNLANGGTYTTDGYTFLATYGTGFLTDTFTLEITAVPEPSAALFVMTGLMGMGLTARRRIRSGDRMMGGKSTVLDPDSACTGKRGRSIHASGDSDS